MNSIWSNLYDRFKDRRYGALFLACLSACFGLLVLAAIIGTVVNEFELQDYLRQVLPVVGSLAVVGIFLAFRGSRKRRPGGHHYPPLSRDELRAARSKLLKDRKEES